MRGPPVYLLTTSLIVLILLVVGFASPTNAEERAFKARANGEFVIHDGGLTVTIRMTVRRATHVYNIILIVSNFGACPLQNPRVKTIDEMPVQE